MAKKYRELSRAKLEPNKRVIISANESDGGFTIAQQLLVMNGSKQIEIFVKGAIHVGTEDGLHELRDALNLAIGKL